MKPISDFVITVDAAEGVFKKAILEAFKTIDEAKVVFIGTYNEARVAMEAEVASREANLRETVAKAVEALNGDGPDEGDGDKSAPSPRLPPAKLLEVPASITEQPS